MGVVHFQPSRLNGLGAPEVTEENVQAAATFTIGAVLQRDAVPGDVEEHAGGATVTGIIGVALQAATSGVPAFGTKVQVARAGPQIEFLGQLSNAGAVVTPDAANLGVSYGIVKVTNDWYVDETDTTNVVLTVTKIMPEHQAVLFKFLASAIAL